MRNLHALLRSKRIKCLFGIVYHLRKNNRLERLKMKNRHLHRQRSQTWNLIINFYEQKKITFAHKVKKFFSKNRRKLWIFDFFDYLCEKFKN